MKKVLLPLFLCFTTLLFVFSCNENTKQNPSNLSDSTENTLNKVDTAKVNSDTSFIPESSKSNPSQLPPDTATGLANAKKIKTLSVNKEARLTRVVVSVNFTGDGVNVGTKFETEVYLREQIHQIAQFDQMDGIGDNAQWYKDMRLSDNRIAVEDLKDTKLYLALKTDGKDKAWGNPLVTFYYNDGTIISYKYRPFRIGTHDGWSHRTDQPVENW